jgi:hypothetical protein
VLHFDESESHAGTDRVLAWRSHAGTDRVLADASSSS